MHGRSQGSGNVGFLLSCPLLQFPWSPPHLLHTPPQSNENSSFYKSTVLTLRAFRLVFPNFFFFSFNHHPQSKIHLNKITCGLVGNVGASTRFHPSHQAEHAGLAHPIPPLWVSRETAPPACQGNREKVHSSAVCQHPDWNLPRTCHQPWGGSYLLVSRGGESYAAVKTNEQE